MSQRELLVTALSEAAEIEHAITCQYLFAAFSLKTHPEEGGAGAVELERVRGWKTELLRVARQEMAHHALVSNLLIVVGGAPQFRRAHFPHPVQYCPPYDRFELLPFGEESVERFACYERAHEEAAAGGAPSIGALYRAIRQGLSSAGPDLFVGPQDHQILNRHLHIGEGQFDVDLASARDGRSAAALIDRILDHDHHATFVAMGRELRAMREANPLFEPARPVVRNPRVQVGSAVQGATLLRHPITRIAAHLFNLGYEAMVLMLTRLYGRSDESPAEVEALIHMAFFPMMTVLVRPLGEILTQMPAGEEPGRAAGPCFELPTALPLQPHRSGAWVVLHERLLEMARFGRELSALLDASSEPWAARLRPRGTLLSENLDRMAQRFEGDMNLAHERVRQLLGRLG